MFVRRLKLLMGLIAFTAAGTVAPLSFGQTPAPPATPEANAPPTLPPEPVADDKSSYSIGVGFGSQLHNSGLEHAVSIEALIRGLKEGLAGKAVSTEDKERSVQLVRVGRDAAVARNRAAASEFLIKNGSLDGVKTTASGLQYLVFSPGNSQAASPMGNDKVTVNYRGRLIDGTEFDTSDAHAQAATFAVDAGVIKGWHEALQMMKPGAKWRLFIPPALAYDAASPPAIPPGSLLIFDIELLKVEPGAATGSLGRSGQPSAKPPAAKHPAAKSAPSVKAGQ